MAKSKADEYRDKARECEELAQVARDPLVQQQILEIAEKWRTMAAFEEKFAALNPQQKGPEDLTKAAGP